MYHRRIRAKYFREADNEVAANEGCLMLILVYSNKVSHPFSIVHEKQRKELDKVIGIGDVIIGVG